MLETFLSLVMLLCPAPDASTPEAAADAFGKEWLRLLYDDAATKQDGLDTARGLFSDPGWTFVQGARQKSASFDEEYAVLKWSFQVRDVKQSADGTASATLLTTVRRNQGRDFRTRKVRVVEQLLPHKVVLVRVGGDWKVKQLHVACSICLAKGACRACTGTGERSCYSCKGGKSCTYCKGAGQNQRGRTCFSCKGNGLCRSCKGNGAQECYSCKGKKQCKYCAGKAHKTKDWSKMWGGDPGDLGLASEDRTSPTSAAQAFLNMRLQLWRARASRAKKRYAGVVAMLDAAPKAIAAEAFSATKARERLKEFKNKTIVEEVEVVGSTAYARLRTTYKKGNARLTRLTLSQRAGVWLVDRVEHDCYSCKGKRLCGTCKGSKNSGACRCKAGQCIGCRGLGKLQLRSGARDCSICKGVGLCTLCKGKGKRPCYSCRSTGKCTTCKGKGWTPAGSRGIF